MLHIFIIMPQKFMNLADGNNKINNIGNKFNFIQFNLRNINNLIVSKIKKKNKI